jgi:hypothetical protein
VHRFNTVVKAGLMLKSTLIPTTAALFAALASAQSTTRPKYLEHAVIYHNGSLATVTANFPLPLLQAISGVREDYGWQVNWEEAPCYSRFDIVDDTGPRWRAKHPDEKGVTRRAGGLFSTSFPEPTGRAGAAESDILSKLVQDYNATDNPGKYALRTIADGQFTVVGIQVRDEAGALQAVHPLLDTPVSIEEKTRSVHDTVNAILAALSASAGKNVAMISEPNNLFRDTQVTLGGHNVEARQLLRQALDSAHRPLLYSLGFDPDYNSGTYLLNVLVAAKAESDELGRRKLVPTDQLR